MTGYCEHACHFETDMLDGHSKNLIITSPSADMNKNTPYIWGVFLYYYTLKENRLSFVLCKIAKNGFTIAQICN